MYHSNCTYTKIRKCWLNWSSKLHKNNERRNTIVALKYIKYYLYNIVRNSSHWSTVVFEKEGISHSNTKRIQLKPVITHLKAHNFVWQGDFFLSIFSCNFDDQFIPSFHLFVINFTHVGKHQVRILVFDNIKRNMHNMLVLLYTSTFKGSGHCW